MKKMMLFVGNRKYFLIVALLFLSGSSLSKEWECSCIKFLDDREKELLISTSKKVLKKSKIDFPSSRKAALIAERAVKKATNQTEVNVACVIASFKISSDGSPIDLSIIKSIPSSVFDSQALKALKSFKFDYEDNVNNIGVYQIVFSVHKD